VGFAVSDELMNIPSRQFLKKYGNYHGLMAMLAGLNSTSIKRLKHTFKEVGRKYLEVRSGFDRACMLDTYIHMKPSDVG